jgi:hypothetical protein
MYGFITLKAATAVEIVLETEAFSSIVVEKSVSEYLQDTQFQKVSWQV